MNEYSIEKSPALDQPWSPVGEITSRCFSTAVCLAKTRDSTGAEYWRAKLVAGPRNARSLGRTKVYRVERSPKSRWRAVEVPTSSCDF